MMYLINKRQHWASHIIGMVTLMMLLVFVGVSSTQAQMSDPYLASLDIPSQEVEVRHSDGTRQNVNIQGHIVGQRDGTASGTIQVDDVWLIYLSGTAWDSLTFDESSALTGVNVPVVRTVIQPDGREDTNTSTLTILRGSSGFDIGDEGLTLTSVETSIKILKDGCQANPDTQVCTIWECDEDGVCIEKLTWCVSHSDGETEPCPPGTRPVNQN